MTGQTCVPGPGVRQAADRELQLREEIQRLQDEKATRDRSPLPPAIFRCCMLFTLVKGDGGVADESVRNG